MVVRLTQLPWTFSSRWISKLVSLLELSLQDRSAVPEDGPRTAVRFEGAAGGWGEVLWMVIVTGAEPLRPPESVTLAVMVCVPTTRSERENEAPVPIWPWRLEVHTSEALILPSCASEAEPEKFTVVPWLKDWPLEGEEMVTVGA